MSTVDLRTLQIFCDLVDTQSFTRAADRNFISQSAVTQRIHTLEHQLGKMLLDRGQGKGKVSPTQAGRLLYEGGKALLASSRELETSVKGLSDEVEGTVHVATVYSVGLHALPGRLKPFLAEHARIN